MMARDTGMTSLGKRSPKLRSEGTDQKESKGGGHSKFREPGEHLGKEPHSVTFPSQSLSPQHEGKKEGGRRDD